MRHFKTHLKEGLIKEPPNVYRTFLGKLLNFMFSHMINETDKENVKELKKLASRYGVRNIRRPKNFERVSYKKPDTDVPYADDDIDPVDEISLFMIYDENQITHNADYDTDNELTGNPAITFYVANYVRDIREVDNSTQAVNVAKQMTQLIQADLKHELMHFVQDIFLANKDERQNQQNRISNKKNKTEKEKREDEIKYFTSHNEFDPTIRSEVGEYISNMDSQPSLKTHIDRSKFFQILKKHQPQKYKLAAKKISAAVARYKEARNATVS